jgi:hypothetical protein
MLLLSRYIGVRTRDHFEQGGGGGGGGGGLSFLGNQSAAEKL